MRAEAPFSVVWFTAAPPRSSSMARLLITGGSGFVLSNVVFEWLSTSADSTAVVFDLPRAWDEDVQFFLAEFLENKRLSFFAGSVSDPAAWASLEKEHSVGFTHIISGAAVTPTRADEEAGAAAILEINLFGSIRALDFARRCDQLKRFIFVSSDAVYEYPGLIRPAMEDEPRPTSMGLYCLSKYSGEHAVARWAELFGLDACCVRFADVYGRLDRDTGARNRHNAPYWVCTRATAGQAVGVRGELNDVSCWCIFTPPLFPHTLLCLLLCSSQ